MDPDLPDVERELGQLLEFLYACPVGLVEIDSSGLVSMINPHAFKHLLPVAGGRDISNLFSVLEGCAPEIRNLFHDFAADHGTVCEGHRIAVDIEMGVNGKDPKFLSCTLVKLGHDRAVAAFSDITIQVAQERRAKQAETWFASLVNGVNDYAVLSITPTGIIDGVNGAFTRQTGQAFEEVTGQLLSDVLSRDPGSGSLSVANELSMAKRDGWYLDESWQQRSNGDRYWCQRLFAARMDDDGASLSGYTVVLRDVVRDPSDMSDIRRMLLCDHLTGAANRAHFLQLFEREQKRWREHRQPLSLILLDVDYFKIVNDVHGHPTGDLVLKQLTQVCRAALRPTDLFARIGGEEFAALLPHTPLEEAIAVADGLREAVAAMVVSTGRGHLQVTASFGCATVTEACATVDGLIKRADDQLYAAKQAGRNRVFGRLPKLTAA